MNERTMSKDLYTSPRAHRRLFGLLAGTLLAGTVVVAPMASGVAQAAPLITGTVTNDANADGVINTAIGIGAEVGLGGVTVELLDASGNSIDPDGAGPLTATTTVTAANGSYSLDATADGTYIVKVTAPVGYIIDSAAAGDVVRTSPTTGESAPVVLAGTDSVVNPLVRPDFVLQLGYLNNPDGIITGSAPFDTTDPACTPDPGVPVTPTLLNDTTVPPGVDCTKYDDNVRSGDNVVFNFAISGSATDDTVTTVADVVVQQTITPTGGAIINFARIPLACVPPTGGSGGTPPPFSKVEYFDGANWVQYSTASYGVPLDVPAAAIGKPLRLTCNKGTFTTGDASTLGTTVRIDPTSPNGSSFTSVGVVYAADNAGNATGVPDGPLDAPAIEIKARPEWDLRKGGFYRQDWTTYDPPGPTPSGPGFFTYYNVMLGSDRKAGNEPLAQPITLADQLYAFKGDGTTPQPLTLGTDYFFVGCRDYWPQSLGGYGGNVISKPSLVSGTYTANMSVQDSGTCTVDGTTGAISWSGIDFGGPYPTQTVTNQSLTAGPYLVANKWIQVWVPRSTLDTFDGVVGNDAGSGFLWNRINSFDPNGVSGNSNYGTSVEPGWCDPAVTPTAANTGCSVLPQNDLLTGQTKSNDVAGPTSFAFSPGNFAKYLLKPNGNDRSYVVHDDMGGAHDGAGTIQPGQYTSTWLHWLANGSVYENPTQCDIWDNTMYQLVTLAEAGVGSNSGVSSSPYATATGAGTNTAFLTYQYAHVTITGDDPLSVGLNGATGRIDGTWTSQRSVNCDQAGVTWYSDPNDPALGGIDNVNAVRVTGRNANQAIGDVPMMTPGQDRLLRVGLKARDVFFTGPHAGEPIPAGAVGANYGKIKASNVSTGNGVNAYNLPSYQPSPENASTDGDRLTWTRAVLGVKKRTIEVDGLCSTPCAAAIDTNGSVLAGQPVVWEILPVLNAASSAPAPVPNLVIKDVLPVYVEYDDVCTAALTGGTPADDVLLNTPAVGQTTLIWNLGSLTPNQPIAPLRICTGTDPLAPAPASVTNRVEFSTVAIPTSKPFDLHTLTLEQSGDMKLRKTVDAPLDVLNDDQVWTISYANFSETVAVQPVRTIEVFPYNGDATPPGGPTRSPASNFDGKYVLTTLIAPKYPDNSAVPGTVYYTADAPNTINQDWNVNTSTWCTSTDGVTFTLAIGAGACPTSLATVTGWMFNESSALAPTSSPTRNRVNIPFTMQAGDTVDPLSVDANQPNNVYTDRFTAFSNTFVKNGVPQRLSSNTVRVRTLGFSMGDWVFDDRNGDGKYTAGTDLPVPDGVTINLYYVPTSGPAVLFDTTNTSGGSYLFTDLPSGNFYVEIPAGLFGVGQLLEGWDITPTPASASVDENDDLSHDTIAGVAGAVRSNTFTLSATVNPSTGGITGDEPKSEGIHGVVDPTLVTDGFNNFAIDLALQSPVVSIGDRVWLDVNRDGLQDANHTTEPGIVGVTVELYAADGTTFITSTTTGTDGFYSFTDLTYSTNYVVKFVLPTGSSFTTKFSGAVAADSNADVVTGQATVITPADGENAALTPDEPTIDAGMVNIDLALAKVLNTAPNFYPGKTVQYTLTPSNLGTTNALAGWKVTDVLPAGLTLVSMAGSAGGSSIYSCSANVCTSAAMLPAGGTAETIIVTATINAGTTGVQHNFAYVSPSASDVTEAIVLDVPTATTDTSTSTTNNDAQADLTSNLYDLALAKAADVTTAGFGDTVNYTITVANQGTVNSGAYTVVDVIPAGLSAPTAISNGGVWAAGPRTITWSLTGLSATDPDTTVALTYTTTVTDLSERPWRNFAEITTDGSAAWGGDVDSTPDTTTTNDGDYDVAGVDNAVIGDAGNGTDPEDDADVANFTNADSYDLALAKISDVSSVDNVGDPINYTITVANQGTLDAHAFTVVDVIPAGLTAPTAISNGGVWAAGPRTITWEFTDLAAGDPNIVLTYSTTVGSLPSAPWKNFAEITADSATDYGAGMTDTDSTPGGGLPNEGTDNTGANAIDQAGVAGDAGYDDQDIAVVTSGAIYDLALAKVGTVTGSGLDIAIDFDITVANQGTLDSGDYTVVDIVPEGLAVDTGSISDSGVYDGTAGTITWSLAGLAPSDTVTVSWSATVSDFTLRPFRNFAEITADGATDYGPDFTDIDSTPDGDNTNDGDYDTPGVDNETITDAGFGEDPEDDADIADVTVELTYDLALAKAPSDTTINPDGTVTFSITVENQGDVSSGDYTVTDTLPAGTQATAASDSGVITATTVTWDLTDLAPGETRTVTVTVEITDITLRPFKNIAEISADGADDYDAVDTDFKGYDVEDIDSFPDTATDQDNGDVDGDGYGTFENPTNDLDGIADVDSIPNGEDDADVAFFDVPVLYDLALVKTGPAAIDGAGTATFTIQVKNQGTVASGNFTVLDTIPAGLTAVSASNGGTIAGQSVTWNLSGLAAGATTSVTVTVRVANFASRPWVNIAEISADGADSYDSTGYQNPADGDVEDDDSIPDANPSNDALIDQTVLPGTQHNDPAVDSDDHDVAPIDAAIVYDLALVKVLPGSQSFKKGSNITFILQIKNQGNVDSGTFTVHDVLPAGLTFVSATDNPLVAGQSLTWDLPSMAPGGTLSITIVTQIVDVTLASYINLAEIVTDGADTYDGPGKDVEDKDSTPDENLQNDPLVDTDDVNIDHIPGDEDDHDRALLDTAKVASDNPTIGKLPSTGSDTQSLLFTAAGLLGAGALALLVTRRRRRRTSAA